MTRDIPLDASINDALRAFDVTYHMMKLNTSKFNRFVKTSRGSQGDQDLLAMAYQMRDAYTSKYDSHKIDRMIRQGVFDSDTEIATYDRFRIAAVLYLRSCP